MMVSSKPKLKWFVISVGVNWSFHAFDVPSPSSPYLFPPHVKIRPVEVRADECCSPKDMLMMVSSAPKTNWLVISVGVYLVVVVPSPSCPLPLFPHVNTLPVEVRTEEL